VFKPLGFTPWEKNPNLCKRCFTSLRIHAAGCPALLDSDVHGADVELSMLFADIRGSSEIARRMSSWEFTHLMSRFYRVAREVLVANDAIIEKFVGDAAVGLFLPFLAGPRHAQRATEAGRALLEATGHRSREGPWAPLGVGVHTGMAFVGVVGTKKAMDFTALGDPVNLAAHLASQAAAGEMLVTEDVARVSSVTTRSPQRRRLTLKGREMDAFVIDG
jgi:adenylate cyclase